MNGFFVERIEKFLDFHAAAILQRIQIFDAFSKTPSEKL